MTRRPLRRLAADEDGAVLVLVALGSTVLVGMLALAIDIGMLYTARSEAQRAADASALAGASAFQEVDPTTNPTEAEALALERVFEFARTNEIRGAAIDSVEVTPEILLDEFRVRVTIRREGIGLWFARVLGFNESAVAAKAAAWAAPAGAANPVDCIKPFAIPDMWEERSLEDDLDGNQLWDFERDLNCNGNNCNHEKWVFRNEDGDAYRPAADPSPTGYGSSFRDGRTAADGSNITAFTKDEGRRIPIKFELVPSYWQVWAINDGTGVPNVLEAIKGCVESTIQIGDSVLSEPGQMTTPIYDEMIDLIVNGESDQTDENGQIIPGRPGDPNAYWDEATGTVAGSSLPDWRKSSRVFTVALFNPEDTYQGRAYKRFVDFAYFFLEDPRVVYPDYHPAHLAPITARLLKFTPAAPGGSGPGNLPRILQLVE